MAAVNVTTAVDVIVFGLVAGQLGQSRPSTTTVVGLVSLVVGLLSSLLLYSLAAIDVSSSTAFIAAYLYLVSLLALAYGLLCIACAAVTGHVVNPLGGSG